MWITLLRTPYPTRPISAASPLAIWAIFFTFWPISQKLLGKLILKISPWPLLMLRHWKIFKSLLEEFFLDLTKPTVHGVRKNDQLTLMQRLSSAKNLNFNFLLTYITNSSLTTFDFHFFKHDFLFFLHNLRSLFLKNITIFLKLFTFSFKFFHVFNHLIFFLF